MIRNGKPLSINKDMGQVYVDKELLSDIDERKQEIVLEWIRDNIKPQKTENTKHSSYGIKHILQSDTDIYLTNNQFKDAMLISGYEPVDAEELNWTYRISEKSPAFSSR